MLLGKRTTPNLYLIQLSFTYIITSNNAVVASKRTMMLRESTAVAHCNTSQSFFYSINTYSTNLCYFHHFPQHIYFIYRDESVLFPSFSTAYIYILYIEMNLCYLRHFPQHIYFIYRDESVLFPSFSTAYIYILYIEMNLCYICYFPHHIFYIYHFPQHIFYI